MWIEVAGRESVGAEGSGAEERTEGGEFSVERGRVAENGVEARICGRVFWGGGGCD